VRYPKYILLFLVSLLLLAPIAGLRAADGGTAKEEQFNPAPLIFNHIADSHEWSLLEVCHIPLPCMLYNRATGKTSIFLYSEGMDKDGYKCEEGKVTREDGAAILDLSITKNVLTMLIGAFILIFVLIGMAKTYKASPGKAPRGLQSAIEPLIVFIRDEVAKPSIGPKYAAYLPYILTIFFFILVLNLLGLLPIFPGGANVTGNIAFTLVLAFIAFLVINVSGTKHYWAHIFWMPGVAWPMKIFLAIIEVIGLITKPVALMIRLFANMVAGHIIITSLICLIFIFGNAGKSIGGSVMGSVIAVPFALFISCIEVLVAFIQAYIFSMLTAVFIGMALEDHSEGHHTTD
jgi:F-type H+-transporting ATPase subunit a